MSQSAESIYSSSWWLPVACCGSKQAPGGGTGGTKAKMSTVLSATMRVIAGGPGMKSSVPISECLQRTRIPLEPRSGPLKFVCSSSFTSLTSRRRPHPSTQKTSLKKVGPQRRGRRASVASNRKKETAPHQQEGTGRRQRADGGSLGPRGEGGLVAVAAVAGRDSEAPAEDRKSVV